MLFLTSHFGFETINVQKSFGTLVIFGLLHNKCKKLLQ